MHDALAAARGEGQAEGADDPFSSIIGPSLNILIEVMSIVAGVFAGVAAKCALSAPSDRRLSAGGLCAIGYRTIGPVEERR